MKMAVLKESFFDGGYYISFHDGEMPAFSKESYDSVQEAKQAHPTLKWRKPSKDSDGDVIAIALY
jgi:hypothetical protein